MLTRAVHYFGNTCVSYLCSDSVLQWTARELSCRATQSPINISIHNSSINLIGESGLIAGIPFSYHSPYSCGTSGTLFYLTELCANPQKLRCYVFKLTANNKAQQLHDEVLMLQHGSLQATQRNYERQESKTSQLKRSHSAENLATLNVPFNDKERRSSDEPEPKLKLNIKQLQQQRRKSVPVKCRDIFEVEYIGVQPAPGSELPDIDVTVRQIQRKVCQGRQGFRSWMDRLTALDYESDENDQDSIKPLTGLLHVGHTEIQLLHSDHTVMRAWSITKIKACSQGQSGEYFGWSCREENKEQQCCIHVFRAKDETQGVSIINSIHKVCMVAYKKSAPSTSNDACKYCPIIIFNSVCDRLIGMDEDDVAKELGTVIDGLSDADSLEVLQTFKTEHTDVNIKNNFLIGCLRSVYERQQHHHLHNNPYTPSPPNRDKVEIKRPPAVTTPTPQRKSIFPLFKHIRDAYYSDSESDSDARPKNPAHMSKRNRSQTATSPQEYESPQPLTMANDRRRIRRQKSCRKAIYDSVHTTTKNRESIVSHQKHDFQRSDSCGSLNSIIGQNSGYDVVSERAKEQMKHWENLLKRQDSDSNKERFKKEIQKAVFSGVPEKMRGKVWKLLAGLRKCSINTSSTPLLPYKQLLKSASTCHNAITLDIGRTFPNHLYFQEQGGEGQDKLCSMLLAYSTHDVEVGYCQGMSFIAGILLVYLEEEEAFNLFLELLNKYDLRDNYKPDMAGLKMRLYQLSRLVHDRHLSVHEHLNTYEVTPFLYAVSWLMTSFATQLPFQVAARIMDFVFLQGIDAIFKVILYIIKTSEKEILALKSFDSIINYMKETIPAKIAASFEYHIEEIFSTDISTDLRDLQIEYKVLHEDLSNANKTELLETKYNLLKQQNKCHANQITQLNRELERSRAEKRGLVEQVERLKGRLEHCGTTISCGTVDSCCTADTDTARLQLEKRDLTRENAVLLMKLADMRNQWEELGLHDPQLPLKGWEELGLHDAQLPFQARTTG